MDWENHLENLIQKIEKTEKNSEKWKFGSNKKLGLERFMNGLEKPFKKHPIQKIGGKKLKLKWNCRMWTKNHYRESEFLFKHRFLTTLKLEQKNFTLQNHSLFRYTSCFGVTKITTPIWLQKSWKCVNRSLKKDSTPIQFKFLEF